MNRQKHVLDEILGVGSRQVGKPAPQPLADNLRAKPQQSIIGDAVTALGQAHQRGQAIVSFVGLRHVPLSLVQRSTPDLTRP
jgi:hypothetical protein